MSHTLNQNLPVILEGCLKQQRDSQHKLYKLFYGYGMSVAIRYATEENEAITIVNDSFMKVFKRMNSYNPDYDFKPWFRKIIVNTSLNHLKKQQQNLMETGVDEANNISDREEILSQINYKELIGLVQSLSTSYRAVFNMYVIDGFRHDEIAKTLGISVSTSKSNLVRARRKLQELLQNQISSNHA